ncbi:hypothetical protein [Abyssalbus ytuae]|uniref:Uncharacterized protein n=1 Tax=Abyssalbus ytuae TaxID=2926907 RepID=A0A9E6ZYG4_9FLAO|nr:hypothetical protein [Abyssalbus ytuae]UOB19276.1 hypothetical protein MQE35_08245 [Abyssalbus ytuae]
MKKKLEIELVNLANRILQMKDREDINALQAASQKLYEKLTILKFVETNFGELPPETGKGEIESKFEMLANSVLEGNKQVPESNPHENEEEIMTPVMDTIRDMVEEMPKAETLEDILEGIMPDPVFVKREAEDISPKEADIRLMNEKRQLTLNTTLKGAIQVGLNDRLAFVKHLFNGNIDDFNRVISQLNSFNNEEDAKKFIHTMVKPDHENWKGKEEYEHRFLELIEARFN